MNPITPENITELKENEIFVFGSNLIGRHGAGAALLARKWGAKIGYGRGPKGKTYAIPTKDGKLQTLPLEHIQYHVHRFINYAKINRENVFLVTQIGCGLAGYSPEEIAPLFSLAVGIENISLPACFLKILIKDF